MDIELLRNIPLFAKFSDEELNDLASLLKVEAVERNQPVFWIGDEGTEFYIVQAGQVVLTFPDIDGKDQVVAVLNGGDFFGELSLLDGGPRTATARANGELRLLALARGEFHQFLRKHPSAAIHLLTVLGHRQREMLEKLRGVQNANTAIEERTTTWQRIADVIAAVSASQAFVLFHVALFAGWMVVNKVMGVDHAFDPYPFNLLTMVVSLEAIFLSIFVLISQNRSGEKDRIRADLDYQVNLKAHLEIMNLHQKLDQLRKEFELRGNGSNGAPADAAPADGAREAAPAAKMAPQA